MCTHLLDFGGSADFDEHRAMVERERCARGFDSQNAVRCRRLRRRQGLPFRWDDIGRILLHPIDMSHSHTHDHKPAEPKGPGPLGPVPMGPGEAAGPNDSGGPPSPTRPTDPADNDASDRPGPPAPNHEVNTR